jgi:hypothetical protein
MSKYSIVAAIDEHFGYLTFHFDGSTNAPYLTDASSLAYGYDTAESAHDIATDLGLDSYEVIESDLTVETDCPSLHPIALIHSST